MAHAVQARASAEIDPNTIADRLDVDKSRYTEVLTEQNSLPRLVGDNDPTDTPEHLMTMLRFADSDPLSEIVQLVAEGTLYDTEWAIVEVHSCTHDRDGGPCGGWKREVERGPVPEAI